MKTQKGAKVELSNARESWMDSKRLKFEKIGVMSVQISLHNIILLPLLKFRWMTSKGEIEKIQDNLSHSPWEASFDIKRSCLQGSQDQRDHTVMVMFLSQLVHLVF